MAAKNDERPAAAKTPAAEGEETASKVATETASRRRWPRRLGIALLIVVVLLLVLIGAAPYIASTRTVSDLALASVNGRLLGEIQLEGLSLSWFGPLEISGLRVRDPEQRDVLQVAKVSLARGVWHLISGPMAFGELSVDSPRVHLYVSADNQVSLAEAFQPRTPSAPEQPEPGPLPEPRGRIVVRDGVIQVTRHDGHAYEIPALNLEAQLQSLANVSGNLDVTLADGRKLVGELALTNAVSADTFDVSKADGKLRLRTDGSVDLGPLAGIVAPELGLVGTADLDIDATAAAGKLRADLSAGVKGLRSEQTAARVNPVDIALKGQIELTAEQLGAQVALSGDAGTADARISYPLSGRSESVALDRLLNGILTGEATALPNFTVEGQAGVDLAALGRAVPGLLRIREGQEITGGKLEIAAISARGGDQPAASGSIRLSDLAATGPEGALRLEPISVDFDTQLEAGKGLRVRQANLTSSFARLTATGMASDLRATLEGDLTRLQSELGKLFDLGSFELAGKVQGTVELARAGDERVNMTVQVTGEGIRYATGSQRFELPQARIRHTGHLALADQKVSSLVATDTEADLNGEVVVTGAGAYDLHTQAFQAELDIRRAELAFLSSRAAALGSPELERYGGSVSGRATIARGSSQAPIVSNGNLVGKGLTVDGQALLESDAEVRWTEVQAEPGGEVRVESAAVEAGVASLSASGVRYRSAEELTLDGQFQCSADLARSLRAVGLIAKLEKPPAVAGQLRLQADCATSAGALGVVGRGSVDPLEFGTGEQRVRNQRLQLEYDVQVDPAKDAIRVAKAQLVSQPLSAELAGTIGQYRTVRELSLSGRYDASWQEICALLHELAPATADTVTITGNSASAFKISGPAAQPDARPPFRGVSTGVDLGWTSAGMYGVALGPAKLSPTLRDGKLTLPVAAIPAAEGKVHLGGVLDFQPAEPTLDLPGKLQILDGVVITPELSRSILSRINPIFLHLTRVEGRASLGTQDVQVPLGESMTTSGRGKGRLDLVDMSVQPGGLLAELLQLGGLTDESMYTVQVSGLDFLLENGRIAYRDFTLTFPKEYDLKFYGSVGLDDTLDLVVSLPVRTALLERLGARGPVAEYAQALTGSRVDIPLVGTRLKPKLDVSQVDIKPLVERAIKESSGKAVEGLLQGLLGGQEKDREQDKPQDRKQRKRP